MHRSAIVVLHVLKMLVDVRINSLESSQCDEVSTERLKSARGASEMKLGSNGNDPRLWLVAKFVRADRDY